MEEDFLIKKNVTDEKKHKKIWPIICIVLAILLLAGGGYYYYTNYYNKDNGKGAESTPDLKDDFYEYYKNKVLVSPMDSAQQAGIENIMDIIGKIEEDPNYVNNEYNNMIETFEDYNERDKNGISELKTYFDRIDNANTLDDFSKIMVDVMYDLDVNSFINFEIMPDLYDNSRNVILLSPMLLETFDSPYCAVIM